MLQKTLVALAGVALLSSPLAFGAPKQKRPRVFTQDRTATLEQVRSWAQKANLPWEVRPEYMKSWHFFWGTSAGRKFVRQALNRSPEHKEMILRQLKERDLPEELLAVPIVESGLANLPASKRSGRAGGLWMFLPATARSQGLKVNKDVDQRMDPEKLTLAAVDLFKKHYTAFQDWALALLAYNRGPLAARKAHAQGKLEYVGKVTAVAILIENPELLAD